MCTVYTFQVVQRTIRLLVLALAAKGKTTFSHIETVFHRPKDSSHSDCSGLVCSNSWMLIYRKADNNRLKGMCFFSLKFLYFFSHKSSLSYTQNRTWKIIRCCLQFANCTMNFEYNGPHLISRTELWCSISLWFEIEIEMEEVKIQHIRYKFGTCNLWT